MRAVRRAGEGGEAASAVPGADPQARGAQPADELAAVHRLGAEGHQAGVLLVRDVVADYSERSLTSALPPIDDVESVVRDVLDRVAGFGPLQRYLDDPEVEEIWVNEPGRVFIARRGRSELTTGWANHASSSSRPVSVMA